MKGIWQIYYSTIYFLNQLILVGIEKIYLSSHKYGSTEGNSNIANINKLTRNGRLRLIEN
jgi:hypothetical protein